uniref:Uncharacterized protein LOC111105312 isoform X2 n=1 Tax=Crassostrea virginica TaxID=6565 RepID=A0A8B8AVV6_CRAVI|nr:uncharacterized protein LOC111105312 isoform X2 [Crassostrea virginica]
MAEGRKPVLETHRVAFNVLSTHLKEFRRRSRRKSPLPPPSEKEIREEVRRILEIFLKKQVENNNEEQTAIPTSFQKVVVEDVIKTEGPGSTSTSREGSRYSSKTSCAKCRSEASQSIPGGSIRSLTDDTIDFPFIDDIDVDDNGDELRNRKWPVPRGRDDIDVDDNGDVLRNRKWPVPRGRDDIDVDDNGDELRNRKWPVPRGRDDIDVDDNGDELRNRKWPVPLGRDDIDVDDNGEWLSDRGRTVRWPAGARGPQRLKSGTESSGDTDYEEELTKISEKEDIPIEPIYASDEDSEVQEMSRDELSDRGSPVRWPAGARGPHYEVELTARWPTGARGPESSDDTDYEEELTKISEKEDIPIEPIYASDEDSEVQEMSRDELSDRRSPARWPAGARGPQRLKSGTESSGDTDYEEELTKISEKEDIPIEPIYASDEDSEVQEMSRDELSDRGSPVRWPAGARGPHYEVELTARWPTGARGPESSDDTDYEEELTKISEKEDIPIEPIYASDEDSEVQEMSRDELSDRGSPARWPAGARGPESSDDTDYEEELTKISEKEDIPIEPIYASNEDSEVQEMPRDEVSDREWPVPRARGPQRLKSGTESSDDTDYEEEVISPGRQKKSISTRLKERMNRSLSRERMKENEEEEKDVKKTRSQSEGSVLKRPKARKKKEEGSSVDKMGQVVQHVHTHKHGHIKQHHYTNGNKSGVLLEKEVWESTDVTRDSEIKHEDRHSNIRESKELPGDGDNRINRRLKKMTSFRKSKKATSNEEVDFDHKRQKSPKSDRTRSVTTDKGYQERVQEMVTTQGTPLPPQ